MSTALRINTNRDDENACPVVTIEGDEPIEVDDGSITYFLYTHTDEDSLIKMAEYYMKKEGITETTPIQLLRDNLPKDDGVYTNESDPVFAEILTMNYYKWVQDKFKEVMGSIEMDKDAVEDGQIRSNLTTISDEQYDDWILQIHRLPPRKRKRWKSSLTDRQGRKSEVRWRYNKLQENHPDWGWTDIQSHRMLYQMGGDMKPRTLQGLFLTACHKMKYDETKNYPPGLIQRIAAEGYEEILKATE